MGEQRVRMTDVVEIARMKLAGELTDEQAREMVEELAEDAPAREMVEELAEDAPALGAVLRLPPGAEIIMPGAS